MSSSKKQSIIVIGFSLILIGLILAYFSLSQPRVYVEADTTSTANTTVISTVSSTESAVYYADSSTAYISYPLNLNTCTAEELMTIDGIGASKASAIIEYREYLGGYKSVDEVKNIKGIGDAFFEKISSYLYV